MKTTKKILCLMLVLTFVFSMAPFAFASEPQNVEDYGDFAAIEYEEAVDVLTALGVMRGDERDGGARNFRPKDSINRAEAAAIIARAVAGLEADDYASATDAFTDMAGYGWANGYIWYCVQAGIITGYGDGRFGPGDNVTGAHMAAMLLRALGYGVNEEYEGPGWDARAIIDARRIGILEGDANFLAPANREQVALYTFNALKTPLVVWNSVSNTYLPYGHILNPVLPNMDPFWTLGQETFGLNALPGTDDLGYLTREWYSEGRRANIITKSYRNNDGLVDEFVATGDHTGRFMANNYGSRLGPVWVTQTIAGVTSSSDIGIEVRVNNTPLYANVFAGVDFAVSGDTDAQFPVGSLVTMYANADGFIDYIVIVFEILAQVAEVDDEGAITDITIDAYDQFGVASGSRSQTISDNDDWAADDWLLIAPAIAPFATGTSLLEAEGIANEAIVLDGANFSALRILEAESVTARITSTRGTFESDTRAGSSMTFDNATYNLSPAINLGFGAGAAPSLEDDQNIFLDSNGLVIGFDDADAAPGIEDNDFVFVSAVQGRTGGPWAARGAQAFVYYTDGSSEAVDLPTRGNNVLTYGADWAAVETALPAGGDMANIPGFPGIAEGRWYAYRTNAAGEMQLQPIQFVHATALVAVNTITQANAGRDVFNVDPPDETRRATSNTVLTIGYDGGDATVRTGFRNFGDDAVDYTTQESAPDEDDATAVAILVIYSRNDAGVATNFMTRIFVITGEDSPGDEGDNIILLEYIRRDSAGSWYRALTPDGQEDVVITDAPDDLRTLANRIVAITEDGDDFTAEYRGDGIEVLDVIGTSVLVRFTSGNRVNQEGMLSLVDDSLIWADGRVGSAGNNRIAAELIGWAVINDDFEVEAISVFEDD